jgi:hypothetical protein
MTATLNLVRTEVVPDTGTIATEGTTKDKTEGPFKALLLTLPPINAPDHAAVVRCAPTLHHTVTRSPALTLHNTDAKNVVTFANTLKREATAMKIAIAETQILKMIIFPYLPSYHSPKLLKTMNSPVQY